LTSQSSSEKAIIISLAAVIVLLLVIGIVGFFYMRKKLLREGAADAPAVSSEVNFSETKKSSEDGTVIAPKKAETENRMIVDAV
jgi:flagellar basal body-associated protein FliL